MLSKQRGYSFSSFALSLLLVTVLLAQLQAKLKHQEDEKALSISLEQRVAALSKAAYFIYISDCNYGDVTNLIRDKYSSKYVNLNAYQVSDISVVINKQPRPHVQIDLTFIQVNHVMQTYLIKSNATISNDGLTLTIKYPFNHNASSGRYLASQRGKNNVDLCS